MRATASAPPKATLPTHSRNFLSHFKAVPDGTGYRLVQSKPTQWVSTLEAARLIDLHPRTLLDLRFSPAPAVRLLKFRPKTPAPGSALLWSTESLFAYVTALEADAI